MKPSHPISIFLLSTSLFSSLGLSQTSATVSIYSNPTFTAQRLCAIECILCEYGTYGQHDCIGTTLSCSSPLENECYCRADLQSAAISYVASCVSSACSNTNDVATAVGIYTQYCETADLTSAFVLPTTTQAVTTALATTLKVTTTTPSISVVSSTVTAANGQPSTVLVTVTPTAGSSGSQTTSPNAGTTSSSNNLDLGPIIGGAIGGVLILGIAAVVITWLILREKRKQRPRDIMAPPQTVSVGSLPTSPPPGYMSPKPHRRSGLNELPES